MNSIKNSCAAFFGASLSSSGPTLIAGALCILDRTIRVTPIGLFCASTGAIAFVPSYILQRNGYNDILSNWVPSFLIGGAVSYGLNVGAASLGFVAIPLSLSAATVLTIASFASSIAINHLIKSFKKKSLDADDIKSIKITGNDKQVSDTAISLQCVITYKDGRDARIEYLSSEEIQNLKKRNIQMDGLIV